MDEEYSDCSMANSQEQRHGKDATKKDVVNTRMNKATEQNISAVDVTDDVDHAAKRMLRDDENKDDDPDDINHGTKRMLKDDENKDDVPDDVNRETKRMLKDEANKDDSPDDVDHTTKGMLKDDGNNDDGPDDFNHETKRMLEDDVDKNDKNDEDDETSDLPVDRGWAWVILIGATWEVFLYGGMLKSYGVFFVEFQERFGSSASETNVMQTIHNIMVSISGILVMNIGLKYISPRTSVFIGGIGSFLSYLLSAFATDIRVMSITIGVMAGVANCMLFLPIVTTIGTHFKKHRGLANSLHVSGSSMGSLVFGPFYTALFDYYGYTGTMMIVSALLLNSLISGALIRPVSFYRKKKKWKEMKLLKTEMTEEKLDSLKEKNNKAVTRKINCNITVAPGNEDTSSANNLEINENSTEFQKLKLVNYPNEKSECMKTYITKTKLLSSEEYPEKGKLLRAFSEQQSSTEQRNSLKLSPIENRSYLFDRTTSYDPERGNPGEFPSPMLGRHRANTHSGRARTFSELSRSSVIGSVLESISRSKIALYASGDVTCETASVGQIHAPEADDDTDHTQDKPNTSKPENKTCAGKVLEFLKTVFDLSIFDIVFVHYLCMAAVAISGSVMMSVYLIPYAKEMGATSRDVSILFIVLSSIDLVSRIFTGILADRKWLKPTTIVAIALGTIGVVCHLIRFLREFWALVLLAVIQGAFGGSYICLYNVILIEHLGLTTFKKSVGFTAMCHGCSVAVFFQLTGLLRDISGNFYYTYHLIGAILLLASALSLTLPLTSTHVKQIHKRKAYEL